MKKVFAFGISYFKPSGKFYTSTCYICQCETLHHNEDSPYMDDVVDHIRRMIDNRTQSLPGLSSKTWDGFVLVEHQDGHPVLIVPKK